MEVTSNKITKDKTENRQLHLIPTHQQVEAFYSHRVMHSGINNTSAAFLQLTPQHQVHSRNTLEGSIDQQNLHLVTKTLADLQFQRSQLNGASERNKNGVSKIAKLSRAVTGPVFYPSTLGDSNVLTSSLVSPRKLVKEEKIRKNLNSHNQNQRVLNCNQG